MVFDLQHKWYYTLLDHDKLTEVLPNAYNLILWQVQSGVDVTEEVAGKLAASLELRVVEQVEKVGDEVSKHTVDKSLSDSWLQLSEEFAHLNLIVIIVVTLLSVILDGIIELLTKVLGSTFLKLSQPALDQLDSLIDDILEGALLSDNIVDGSHQVREDTDTEELNHHLEEEFIWRVTFEVSVADRGERGDYPINRCHVHMVVVRLVNVEAAAALRSVLRLLQPAAGDDLAYIHPGTAQYVDGREHVYNQVDDETNLLNIAFVHATFGHEEPDHVWDRTIHGSDLKEPK